MGRNGEGVGVVLLLLLAGSMLSSSNMGSAGRSVESSVGRAGSSFPGRAGSRLPLSVPDLGSLAGEFHRMVGIMEKVDSLGQMAVNPPRLPEPSQLINTSALPDMSVLMDVMGPILGNLTGEKK